MSAVLRLRPSIGSLLTAMVTLLSSAVACAAPPDAAAERRAIIAEPQEVLVSTAVVTLTGARDARQLVVTAKYPDKSADPIIVHPDIRRVLMTIRAFNEAARAFVEKRPGVWKGR